MTLVAIDPAQTQLSSLVARARAGEEIVLTQGKQAVARIVPALVQAEAPIKKRTLGGYEGVISFDENVFKPLTDEEMKEYGFE